MGSIEAFFYKSLLVCVSTKNSAEQLNFCCLFCFFFGNAEKKGIILYKRDFLEKAI